MFSLLAMRGASNGTSLGLLRLGMAIHCEEERGAHVGPSGHGLL